MAALAGRRLFEEALGALVGEATDRVYVLADGGGATDLVELARSRWPGAAVVAVGAAVEGADETWPADEAAHRLTGRAAPAAPEARPATVLSPREQQVLALLRAGAGTAAVAEALGTTVHTARTHIQNVLNRLGASSRVEAVAIASRTGGGFGRDHDRNRRQLGPEGVVRVAIQCASGLDAALLGAAVAADGVDVVDDAGAADVVVVDAGLAGGAAARTATLKRSDPAPRVVVLCDALDDRDLRELVEAGADGFVRTDQSLDDAVATLHLAAAGEPAIPPAMLGTLLRGLIQRHREEDAAIERYTRLSSKERSVLAMLADGLDHEDIAAALVLSPHTARTHIQNVLRKLGVHSRLEAVALVDRYGLLRRFPPDAR